MSMLFTLFIAQTGLALGATFWGYTEAKKREDVERRLRNSEKMLSSVSDQLIKEDGGLMEVLPPELNASRTSVPQLSRYHSRGKY